MAESALQQNVDQMIDLGVDGLITDRPDLGRVALAKRNLALPAPTPVEP